MLRHRKGRSDSRLSANHGLDDIPNEREIGDKSLNPFSMVEGMGHASPV